MEETREITERNENEKFEIYDNYIFQEETIHAEDEEDEYPELDDAVPEPEPPKEDPVPQPDEAFYLKQVFLLLFFHNSNGQ